MFKGHLIGPHCNVDIHSGTTRLPGVVLARHQNFNFDAWKVVLLHDAFELSVEFSCNVWCEQLRQRPMRGKRNTRHLLAKRQHTNK